MRLNKYIIISGLVLLSSAQIYAQGNANTMLRAVYSKMMKANDYSVQANIKVDMPFIRILPVEVKIYYKQKDKFKVESKSIAVVPRQGFDQIPKLLADSNSFTSMVQGDELVESIPTKLINVIPLSDTGDLILAKFWVDPKRSVIMKSQLTTRSSGTILTEYTYGSQVAYGLPDQMIFSVDVNKFKMPKGVATEDANKNASGKEEKGKDGKKGKIFVVLTNYQVNKGIPDSVFKK